MGINSPEGFRSWLIWEPYKKNGESTILLEIHNSSFLSKFPPPPSHQCELLNYKPIKIEMLHVSLLNRDLTLELPCHSFLNPALGYFLIFLFQSIYFIPNYYLILDCIFFKEKWWRKHRTGFYYSINLVPPAIKQSY